MWGGGGVIKVPHLCLVFPLFYAGGTLDRKAALWIITVETVQFEVQLVVRITL